MAPRVAIIGDNFMLPDAFRDALIATSGLDLDIRMRRDNWPGDPLVHGHTKAGMDGLKEYFGDADEVVEFVDDAQIFITHLAPLSGEMLERLPALKLVAVARGGPVNINLDACRERQVLVVNTPGRNSSAVAEFTVGAILTESRKIRAGHEALRAGQWRDDLYRADSTGRELSEQTVGIVGYGAIGRMVARMLRAFGCRIVVYDPYSALTAEDEEAGVRRVAFPELLEQSDVVTLHAKVTPETRGMMDAAAFARMKPGALLVNTTRGSLCDDEALYRALKDGPLGSAVIDTFTTEPVPSDSPLIRLPNVTVTPHIAGASVRTISYAAGKVAEEVRRFLAGKPPINPC